MKSSAPQRMARATLPARANLARALKGSGSFSPLPLVRLNFKCTMPPSANRMWRHANGRTYKEDSYVTWLEETAWEIKRVSAGQQFANPVAVQLNFPRIHKGRDLDNCIKPMLDAIQRSGAIKNDNLVHRIEAFWRPKSYLDHILVWVNLEEAA